MKKINHNEEPIDDDCCLFSLPLSREDVEKFIVLERGSLYNKALPCGAYALYRHLHKQGVLPLPSVSTIGRILVKHCLTNGRTGYYPEDYQ